MVDYKSCREVDKRVVFQAFQKGFSDYMINFQMTEEFFIERFFGAEGNSLDHSYIALENSTGIGVILGGIRAFDGLKTMRCGAMCISPEWRGKGVAKKLLELHKQMAKNENCQQLFLEVIVGNDRAIKFYEKNGYRKVYDLSYYSTDNIDWLKTIKTDKALNIDFRKLKKFRDSFQGVHINWQNEMDYIKKTDAQHFGILDNQKLVGAISIEKGKIMFIAIDKNYRNQGLAKILIKAGLSPSIDRLSVSFPNNSSLEGYFRKLQFKKNELAQYEMYSQINSKT